MDYFGYVILSGKLAEPTSKTCDAVKNFKHLRTNQDVRSFRGLCNVFRRFVRNFARISARSTGRSPRGSPTRLDHLSDDKTKSLEVLRARLVYPIFALPRIVGELRGDTDACNEKVGCVLLQKKPVAKAQPVGYWSWKLSSPEINYSTAERECLAVV